MLQVSKSFDRSGILIIATASSRQHHTFALNEAPRQPVGAVSSDKAFLK